MHLKIVTTQYTSFVTDFIDTHEYLEILEWGSSIRIIELDALLFFFFNNANKLTALNPNFNYQFHIFHLTVSVYCVA